MPPALHRSEARPRWLLPAQKDAIRVMVWFGIILACVTSMAIGQRWGYRRGYDDCEFSHDFDRCAHCHSALGGRDEDDA
jgi:hypothetical protein